MAGLKSKSEEIRNNLVSKNYFKPTNVYDLNTDVVTRTLNTLSAAGYDLRNNLLANTLERTIDNTPLVNVGYQRLAIEMGRRVANNLTNNFQVNPNAIFDKNPNTRFISKRTDFTITPRNQDGNRLSKVLNTVTNAFGSVDESSRNLFSPSNVKVGKRFYYDNLGAGQKQQLNTLIQFNYYGNWTNPNTTFLSDSGIDNRINSYVDGREKPQDGEGLSYIFGRFDTRRDIDLFAENRYTSEDNGDAPLGFSETITSGKMIKKALDEYEFGRTSVEKDSETSPEQYRSKNADLVWGDDTTFPENAKRGLLYYTRNILKTNTQASKLIDQSNKSYRVDNKLVYKGTKCRSWTVKDQYDEFSKLIRYKGNGNEDSVLKDSVFVHQYPRFNDTEDDKRRYMFSLENLAWTREDFNNANVPECEIGSFGGRLMWFPFYGIEFSETATADIESTKFIGRIEPMYTYGGSSRKGTLKFILIMDYPGNIRSYQGNESNFFQNCDGFFDDSLKPVIKTNTQTNGDQLLELTDTNSITIVNNITEPSTYPTYYFENDIFTIDLEYEITSTQCSLPINQNFLSQIDQFSDFLRVTDANKMVFNIAGYASQLTTSLYNLRLGFKRAYNLMKYIESVVNQNAQNESEFLVLEPISNFIDENFNEKTLNDLNKTKVIFKDQRRNISFQLSSFGESVAISEGALAINKDACDVKIDRKAVVSKVFIEPKDTSVVEGIEPDITTIDILNQTNLNEQIDTTNTEIFTDNVCRPFEEYTENTKFPVDFEKLKYFRPAYHSQTPEDFHKRLTFLQQLTRPGSTIDYENPLNGRSFTQGKNSIFGRMPVCVLRLGDFYHTKIIIDDINFNYINTWDLNPEGMGVQPMIAEVTMTYSIIGGQSMKTYVDRLQRAVDFNFYANSTFNGDGYYGNSEKETGPFYQQTQQIRRKNINNT